MNWLRSQAPRIGATGLCSSRKRAILRRADRPQGAVRPMESL